MFYRLLLLVSVVLFAGCASNPMQVSATQTLQQPQSDMAQVVFMRSSFFGAAINASLYDVTDGEIQFIGIIANDTKIPYETEPGKRVFMVVSEAADFMEANLDSGKNYFSIATPRMGAWKARFSLWPIKNDPSAEFQLNSKDFEKWVSATKLVENTDKSKAWFESNKRSVQQKYDEYWPVWKNKSAEELSKRTLEENDNN
ncbi:hypothetical protein [Aliiglaciecola lipolytica]|uniref:Lipoprotein n=1 Tax=Aliiglaciecola lipolytica E3 TaxID=1127673 RepID=K6Y8C2_9ALTE|nr:hypothetical protein [Aliiglaciecola lipolytica]GAC12883.1 hypothetical protein GLIP_0229 [Aliiglaciecola lipolytica E3]